MGALTLSIGGELIELLTVLITVYQFMKKVKAREREKRIGEVS